MLELIEAVSGRLIDSKTWDRIVGNVESCFGQSVIVYGMFGLLVL